MTDEQIAAFITRLHDKTISGEVRWENTANESAFEAPFTGYKVAINEYSGFDPEIGETFESHQISIKDLRGREVDSFNPWGPYMKGFPAAEQMFRETYEAARRKARGLDEALTVLLGELESGQPAPSVSDDDIPF